MTRKIVSSIMMVTIAMGNGWPILVTGQEVEEGFTSTEVKEALGHDPDSKEKGKDSIVRKWDNDPRPPSDDPEVVAPKSYIFPGSLAVGYRTWLNRWQTSLPVISEQTGNLSHFATITSDPELVSSVATSLTLGRFSLSGSFSPELTFQMPDDITAVSLKDSEIRVSHFSAKRKEWDIAVEYQIFASEAGSSLSIGGGLKRVDFKYDGDLDFVLYDDDGTIKRIPFIREFYGNSRMSGLSLDMKGGVPLWKTPYGMVGMYGSFAYGALKTKSDNSYYRPSDSQYTPYHLSEVGLSFTYPRKEGARYPSAISVVAGYRAQTFYTEQSLTDTVDTTEGFVVGFSFTF